MIPPPSPRLEQLSNPGKATLISSLLERVTSGSRPLAFYEGSDSNGNPLLISFKFLKSWIIRLPNSAYALPRSWLDLEGEAVTLGWQDAVQTVLSLIFARPGILLVSMSKAWGKSICDGLRSAETLPLSRFRY